MCVVCGCSQSSRLAGPEPARSGAASSGSASPEGPQIDPHSGDLHYGAGAAKVSVPGMSQARAIKLEQDILGANQRIAEQNRAHFAAHGVDRKSVV